MSGIKIVTKDARDLSWSFNDGKARFYTVGHNSVEIDPFPAYAHDLDVVREYIDKAAKSFPLPWPVTVFLASLEAKERTNAHANVVRDYSADAYPYPVKEGYIFISGKRIPPHYAYARYLCGHEYGHLVEKALNALYKHKQEDGLVQDYAVMRGIQRHHASGGTWHESVAEVFACDFRILVAGIEPDFWPHQGVPLPESDHAVVAWWSKAQSDWAEAMELTAPERNASDR
jgi:hypothetical protein